MKAKEYAAETLLWLHLPIPLVWGGLFLVPTSLWQAKVQFHFYFVAAMVAVQIAWGLVLLPVTKKYRMTCPLTTAMQLLRGYPVSDERNNNHSFIKEFCERCGAKVPKRAVTMASLISFGIVSIQYFLAK